MAEQYPGVFKCIQSDISKPLLYSMHPNLSIAPLMVKYGFSGNVLSKDELIIGDYNYQFWWVFRLLVDGKSYGLGYFEAEIDSLDQSFLYAQLDADINIDYMGIMDFDVVAFKRTWCLDKIFTD